MTMYVVEQGLIGTMRRDESKAPIGLTVRTNITDISFVLGTGAIDGSGKVLIGADEYSEGLSKVQRFDATGTLRELYANLLADVTVSPAFPVPKFLLVETTDGLRIYHDAEDENNLKGVVGSDNHTVTVCVPLQNYSLTEHYKDINFVFRVTDQVFTETE